MACSVVCCVVLLCFAVCVCVVCVVVCVVVCWERREGEPCVRSKRQRCSGAGSSNTNMVAEPVCWNRRSTKLCRCLASKWRKLIVSNSIVYALCDVGVRLVSECEAQCQRTGTSRQFHEFVDDVQEDRGGGANALRPRPS